MRWGECRAHGARGAETVESITAAGGRARFVGADLGDPADLQRLVEGVGDIDILVNNARFAWFGATADLKVETFDALFASNVRAAFFLVAAFAPGMAPEARAASSTSAAWPARSASRVALPTGRRRPPSRR